MRFVEITGGEVTVDLSPGDCFSLALACLVASEAVDDDRAPLFHALAAAFEAAGMVADMAGDSVWVERQSLLDYRAKYDTLTVAERARLGAATPAQEGGQP